MPNLYRTTDEIVASRLEDGKQMKLHLQDMNLFACGAFSNVYRGVAQTESNVRADVVVKKTWPRHKGSPLEVRILGKLNRLKHKNIVRLLYSYQNEHNGKICLALIFEYVPLNLHQYLKQNNRKIDIVEIKMIAWQMFRGQYHLQRMEICHRDIKPQNLLFNEETGLLKISDFGSSTFEARKTSQPSYHVTRYYRPPELLLGAKIYGCEIDIWSCGCVFAELLKGGVFIAGKNTNNQAELIFELLGKPNVEDLQAMRANEGKTKEIMTGYEVNARGPFPDFSFMTNPQNSRDRRLMMVNTSIKPSEMVESVAILQQILVYNPFGRLAGHDLLMHQYFNQLFLDTTVRSNGKKISCLSMQDWNAVKIGDKTVTGENTNTDEQ